MIPKFTQAATRSSSGCLAGAILFAAAWAVGLPASALAPEHRWRTLETPHFEVHFHEGLYPLALRAARSLEAAHEQMVPLLAAQPRRKTQVVLSDDTDSANGSATASLRPRIWLLAPPPDDLSVLGDYDDYVFLLVAHEYVHVLHLGLVSGVPSWLNWIFGDLWTPNGVHPRFFTEGLATYHESQLTSAGRIRSAIFDMYLRADVLDDRVLPLSRLTSGTLLWPRGTAAYLYGGRMLAWLAETRGDEAVQAYIHAYGRNLIPYFIDHDLRQSAGVDFNDLWEEWVDALRLRYREQMEVIRSRGPITEPRLRTSFGEQTGAPRFSHEGNRLYYVESTSHGRPRLRALDVGDGGDRAIRELGASGTIAPLPDSRDVLLARPEFHGSWRIYSDLFLVSEDGERRLSEGLRASEPDVDPAGAFAYFVRRDRGRTALFRLPLDGDHRSELVYQPPDGAVVYTPRVSPDGAWLAFSQSRPGGGRDILVIPAAPVRHSPPREAEASSSLALRAKPSPGVLSPPALSVAVTGGGTPILLTNDGATDLDPSWMPDGGAVIFASDRSGVFNLYAVPFSRPGELTRLTNVVTGAFQPDVSPDGQWLAWTTYGSGGFDVAAIEFASLSPTPAEPFVSDRPPAIPRDEGAIYPIRRYAPLETLGPQSWFPYLGSDRAGTILGATLAGSDVVGRHAWTLAAGYGIDSQQAEAAASYRYAGSRLQPTLAGGSSFRSTPGFPLGTTERNSAASLGVSWPWSTTRSSQSLGLAYQATYFAPLDAPVPSFQPRPGLATELQLSWQLGTAEQPAESVSPEDGVAVWVFGRAGSPHLGGDYEYAALDLSAAAYLRVPWTRHHVLLLSGRAGLGTGELGERRLYGLGGPQLRNPLIDLLFTGQLLGSGALRGYVPGAFVGSHLLLGTVEYRFPLLWIDRSPGTLPVYVGKLAAAIFADAGNAFDEWEALRLHPSVGAELRLGVDLGWGFAGSIRLGHAYGFDAGPLGGHRPYLGVGASF